MKIGDVVLLEEVINQTDHKWVVLSPLTQGENDGVTGGRIYALEQSVTDADNIASELWGKGEDALVVEGLTPGIILGGVFVT